MSWRDEAIARHGVVVVTQILILPIFGLHTTQAQNLKLGAAFTLVSFVRSFALRRLFEAIRVRSSTRTDNPLCDARHRQPVEVLNTDSHQKR